jgi:hypothetical protein
VKKMQDIAQVTSTAVVDSLTKIISYLPNVLGALVVVFIGVVVAWAVKFVIIKGLGFIKIKKYTDAVGLGNIFTEKVEFVTLLGDLAKWTIIIAFLIPAFQVLNLDAVNEIVVGILSYIPDVVKAVVAIVIGAVVADLASRVIRSAAASIGTHTADIAADVARWAIMAFVLLGALQQLNILPELISTITIGAVAFFVIAGGLAFGLGGKDAAADTIANFRKRLPKQK